MDSYVTGSGVSFGESGGWSCSCKAGWTGPDCSHPLESNCADDIDNDNGENRHSFLLLSLTSFSWLVLLRFVRTVCELTAASVYVRTTPIEPQTSKSHSLNKQSFIFETLYCRSVFLENSSFIAFPVENFSFVDFCSWARSSSLSS